MSRLTKAQQQEKAEAIAKLREWIKPGDKVYTILRGVSRSGMQREIGVILMQEDGCILHPNYLVLLAIGARQGKRDGILMGGCGMDMGFQLVYSLGRILFPDGFKVDGRGRNGDMSGWDSDGGYALRHVWL